MLLATRRLVLAGLSATAVALTGCQTYTSQTAGRDSAVRSGNLAAAVAQADKDAENKKDGKDGIIFRLEQGAILRSAALANIADDTAKPAAQLDQTATNQALQAGNPVSPRIAYLTRSIAAFNAAEERINDYEEKAKISVGNEAGALLTNQANLPYKGRAYDKVMMNTYKALNYLQLGDSDAARVELNRALQRQRDAVDANAKRIEEAKRLAEEARSNGVKDEQGRKAGSYDVDKAKSNPRTAAALASVEAELDSTIQAYGDYVNPFAVFLDGLVFTAQGTDASDLERGRKSFERVAAMSPNNPYLRADLAAAEALAQGRSSSLVVAPEPAPAATTPVATEAPAASTEPPAVPAADGAVVVAPAVLATTEVAPAAPVAAPVVAPAGDLVYVLFETGTAPFREQIRIDIPVILVTNGLSYVGAAFPKIKTVADYAPALTVTAGAESYPTSVIASMDSVVAQDFKNEWPTILTKTLISTATKAITQAIIQKQLNDQGGMAGLVGGLAMGALNASTNIADTRTWRTLPKQFQYARLPVPADRQLTLSAAGNTQVVAVEPGRINVVYVKSTGTSTPLLVSQFSLKN
jgi:hypothetical protein